MVLEVGGSSPLIYPITVFEFELILKKPDKIFLSRTLQILLNSYKVLFNIYSVPEIRFLQRYSFIFSSTTKLTTYTKFYKPLKLPLLSRASNLFHSKSSISSTNIKHRLFKTFKLFISTTYYNPNSSLDKNYIFRDSYYYYGTNFSTLSLNKVFIIWKNYHYLLFNLFFYDIKLLSFSNSFFINETNALNFFINKSNLLNFRRINPFIFFTLSQIIDYGDMLFRKLRYNGINTSLVIDTIQHSKTLYYLKYNRFFNIGLVTPSSYSKYLDVYLPVGSNSLFTQLFTIRYFLILKKQANLYSFQDKVKIWDSLKVKFIS